MNKNRIIVLTIFLIVFPFIWIKSKAKEPSAFSGKATLEVIHKSSSARIRLPASGSISPNIGKIKEPNKIKKSIRELLKNNDFCGYLRQMNNRLSEEEEDVVAEHLMGPQINRDSNDEVDWTVEDYFTRGYGESLTRRLGIRAEQILKFYNALYWSQFLSNYRPKIKLQRSYELLEELTQKYPQNGYFHLYFAAVNAKMGKSQIEIDRQIELALESEDFPDYELEINQMLFEDTFTDRYIDILALRSLQNGNSPNIDPEYAYKVLKSYIDRSSGATAQKSFELAKKLMSDGQELYREADPNLHWSLRRYALGKSMMFSSWKKLHPQEEVPEPWNKKINELLLAYDTNHKILHEKQFQQFDRVYEDLNFCPMEALVQYQKEQRELFYKFRRK